MSNTCPNCSAAIDADAVFCMSCGKSVLQTIACPKCNGIVPAAAKFCKYCAFDLSKPAPQATATEQPEIAEHPASAEHPTAYFQTAETAAADPTPSPILTAAAPAPLRTTVEANQQEDKRIFVTPSAAAFAVICFFLPWLEFSCGGYGGRSLSGADLAGGDGSLWLIPLAALMIVGAFFLFRSQKKLAAAIPVTMGAFAFVLYFLQYKVQSYQRGIETPFGGISYGAMGFSPQIGEFLTAISFLAAWLGCIFLIPVATDSTGQKDAISPNKAAALCYLLFPLPYFIWLVAPLIFLFKESYKNNKFIRFHAVQSVLLGAVQIAISIFIAGIFLFFELGKPAYERGTNSSAVYFLALILSTVFITLAGFLAYKSAMGEQIRLGFIGDWAIKLADKNIQLPNLKIGT